MATPKLFKSFNHEQSKQVYLDGGLSGHNNPIVIADTEYRAICSGSKLSAQYPDFIVSVGTGLGERIHSGKKSTRPRKRKKDSVRNRTKALRDPVMSSIDSQRAWDEYINLVPASSQSAFIRINPELNEDIPEIDDFTRMYSLQTAVRTYLMRDNQIDRISGRLIATLFYFEVSEISPSHSGGEYVALGMVPVPTSVSLAVA
jgi:hypothetical protein